MYGYVCISYSKKQWDNFYPVKMNYLNYSIFIFPSMNTCNTWKTNTRTDQPKAFSLHLPSTTAALPVLDSLQFSPPVLKWPAALAHLRLHVPLFQHKLSLSRQPSAWVKASPKLSVITSLSTLQPGLGLLPQHHSALRPCHSLSYWATLTQLARIPSTTEIQPCIQSAQKRYRNKQVSVINLAWSLLAFQLFWAVAVGYEVPGSPRANRELQCRKTGIWRTSSHICWNGHSHVLPASPTSADLQSSSGVSHASQALPWAICLSPFTLWDCAERLRGFVGHARSPSVQAPPSEEHGSKSFADRGLFPMRSAFKRKPLPPLWAPLLISETWSPPYPNISCFTHTFGDMTSDFRDNMENTTDVSHL